MLDVHLSRLPGSIRRLKTNRQATSRVLGQAGGLTMSPHNDPGNEATLTVIFDTEREAIQYAERPGVHRIYDNSKHVYTNWDPILNQRSEEHTSELQSLMRISYAVFCLKKK